MECIKCGADYPAKELKCPYCGEPNHIGMQWQHEENTAEQEFVKTKDQMKRTTPLYVVNKVVNTVYIVIFSIAAVALALVIISSVLEEKRVLHKQQNADYEVAKAYYDAEDYLGLDQYLDDCELNSSVEWYGLFAEAVRLDKEYHDFMSDWMRYEEQCLDVERINELPYYSVMASGMLENCKNILKQDSYFYHVDYEENRPLYDKLAQVANIYLTGEFGYTEEEIQTYFYESTLSYSEFDQIVVREAFARKGWAFHEPDQADD